MGLSVGTCNFDMRVQLPQLSKGFVYCVLGNKNEGPNQAFYSATI